MCLNLCLFSALLLGVLYLFFGAFAIVFANNHNFELWQIGLTFSGLLVGQLLAISTDPFWHKNYIRLVENREKNGGEPGGSEPEFRLPPAIAGGPLVPIGLIWYDFTRGSPHSWPHWNHAINGRIGLHGLSLHRFTGSVSNCHIAIADVQASLT